MHVMPIALQAKCAIDKAILTNYYRPRNGSGWSGPQSIMMPFLGTYKRAPSVGVSGTLPVRLLQVQWFVLRASKTRTFTDTQNNTPTPSHQLTETYV